MSRAEPVVEIGGLELEAEWREALARCPSATFFHSPAWYRSVASLGGGARVRLARFETASGRRALLPFLEWRVRAGLGRVRHSGAAGCYGGWLADAPLPASEATAIAGWLWRRGFRLRVNPWAERLVAGPGVEQLEDHTQAIELGRLEGEAELRASVRHSVRKNLKKAERAGLRVRRADSDADWQAYDALYRASLRRWGARASSRYPAAFFRQLRREAGEAAVLWLVEDAHGALGGQIDFYHGGHAVEWHAAFDERGFAHGARVALVYAVVRDALERGFAIYDFNPSGGHEGTRAFKRNFGAREHPAPTLLARSPWTRWLRRLRSAALPGSLGEAAS